MPFNIYWLRENDIDRLSKMALKEGWLVDLHEIYAIYHRFPYLCYGVYEKDVLIGAITGYLHEKSAWIGNFIIVKEYRGRGFGKRLFDVLLNALKQERDEIYLNAAPQAVMLYSHFGFKSVERIGRYMRAPKEVKFNLNSEQLKEYENIIFENIAVRLDIETFKEDRSAFLLEDMLHKSSLRLTQPNGFLHARMIGEGSCFIGAFEVRSGAYLDAEKLIRALLHHKSLKKVYSDIPCEYAEIRDLYEKYNFIKVGETIQMRYGGAHNNFKYENVYGFASTGVCG